jgi:hypothetical protein
MHYTGKNFSNNESPAVFKTVQSASDTGKFLIEAYPLLRKYKVTVEPAAPERPGK